MQELIHTLIDMLTSWGYPGMFVAAFLAGSVVPFSSEAVLLVLLMLGLDPLRLLLVATVGNTAGSMFNYWIGTFGRIEWIEHYLHVRPERVAQMSRWMEHYGAWIGLVCFLPFVGSAVSVTLGFMRANPWFSTCTICLGKGVRYAFIILAVTQL